MALAARNSPVLVNWTESPLNDSLSEFWRFATQNLFQTVKE